MARIREGSRAALVVVDMQAGVVRDAWDRNTRVGNAARAVEKAREAGVPVLWVQHNDQELVKGSPDWEWAPELVPAPGEPRVDKEHNSGFEDTVLETELAARGVSHVYLAGAATNWCIRATAYGALDRGYDLTLISDAHTTGDLEPDDSPAIPAAQIVAELNVAMTWLSYPGRRCTTVGTGDLVFGKETGSV